MEAAIEADPTAIEEVCCTHFLPALVRGEPVRLFCRKAEGHDGPHVYPSGVVSFHDADVERV